MAIWLGYDIIRQQIGSKKVEQKRNASTISQIYLDYKVKMKDLGRFFHELGYISTFFEIGGIYTFQQNGTLKITQNRPNLDPRSALLCFFYGAKNRRDPCRSQTCQPLTKENLESHKKKMGDCSKSSEILFFFPIKIKRNLFPLGELSVSLNLNGQLLHQY